MDISPDGSRAVIVGDFKHANGALHDQVVMLDLNGSSSVIDPNWNTSAFTARCASNAFDTHVKDVDFSPDGSYFAIAATGGNTFDKNTDGTRSLCDTASRWETDATGTNVQPMWVDYTGNDSFWSVAVTGTAIYAGGHQRWVNNPNASDTPGTGSIPRPGIVALDPVNGMPYIWNPGRNPRGAGAYALLATPQGLYVGSDTDYIGNFQYKRGKVAFFPLAGGETPPSTATAQLPANLYQAGPTGTGSPNSLIFHPVNGSQIGSSTTVATSISWGSTRGAFMAGNTIFYGNTNGNFYGAAFDGTTVSTPVVFDPYEDPYWDSVQTGSGQTYKGMKPTFYAEMSSVTGAFYANGRMYYSQQGKSSLYWRYFEPDSGAIGGQEFTVSGANFSNVAGVVLSGSTLYYANGSNGTLHTMPFVNGVPNGSGDTTISTPGIDWRARGLFLYGSSTSPNKLPTARATSSCTGLSCTFDGSGSSDPDGMVASYAWDFGDQSQGSGVKPSHAYARSGSYDVSLVVTDNRGGQSAAWTGQVTVQGASIQVGFVARAGFNGITASPSVVVPAAVTAGQSELLFVSAGTVGVTSTAPTGWQQIAQRTNSPLETTVFQRVAGAGDAGSTVAVSLAASARVDLQLVVYSGVASGLPVLATGGDANTVNHVTPGVSVAVGGSWVVSYWADRTSNTTVWTLPAGVPGRGAGYGTGGGRVDSAVADSGAPVASGSDAGLTASGGAVSGKGDTVAIVLAPGP